MDLVIRGARVVGWDTARALLLGDRLGPSILQHVGHEENVRAARPTSPAVPRRGCGCRTGGWCASGTGPTSSSSIR